MRSNPAVSRSVTVYLEVGARRVFAGALDWPGWCGGARDDAAALQALVDFGPRYAAAIGTAASDLQLPSAVGALEVVHRLEGTSATDFGVPAVAPPDDDREVSGDELSRLSAILQASWSAFDRAAEGARGVELRKGPRGGGRELEKIVSHVLGAEMSYLASIGGSQPGVEAGGDPGLMADVRRRALEALSALARGEPLRRPRSGRLWSPRYFIRRSAWHALDHAWEVEDRASPATSHV